LFSIIHTIYGLEVCRSCSSAPCVVVRSSYGIMGRIRNILCISFKAIHPSLAFCPGLRSFPCPSSRPVRIVYGLRLLCLAFDFVLALRTEKFTFVLCILLSVKSLWLPAAMKGISTGFARETKLPGKLGKHRK